MKKLLFISILFSCSVFAKWHDGSIPPEEGQLFMTIKISSLETPEKLQKLIITHYDKSDIRHIPGHSGWWDVTKEDLWEWVNGDYWVIYYP